MKKNVHESAWITALFFIGTVIVANLWAYLYVTKSRFIYSWDNTLYWSAAKSLSGFDFNSSIFGMLKNSIANDEYNMLPSILPALTMKIFGTSRLAFIMSVVNLYFVPATAVIFAMSRRYVNCPGLVSAGIVLALPIMLFTGLVGFLDIGGVLIGLLVMWIYFTRDKNKKSVLRYIVIGILLILMMMFRRYYAFFGFSFVTAIIGESIIYGRKKSGIFIMLLVMGIVLLFPFRDFLFSQLLRDYGELYSGYKFSIRTDMLLVTRYFGIIPLTLIVGLSVWVFVKERCEELVFLWMQILLCFFMFVSTQTHGQQHLLLYVPAIVMIIFIIVPNIQSLYLKVLCILLSVAISVNTLVPRNQPQSIKEIKHFALIPDFSMLARVRSDADEVLKVKQYLNETVGIDKKVGVLASGLMLNEDILRNCEESLGIENEREDFFVNLPSVDSRDSDFSALYSVDYMVVAYPAQTHLGDGKQRIITEAVSCFYNNTGFADAFMQISEKMKIGDISIYVYKRTRDVNSEEKAEFEALFI